MRIIELEEAYAKSDQDRKDTITRMNKQMADLTSAHEFQLNSMKLKLEAAQVRLREMQDFAVKKKAIEDENAAYVHIIIFLLVKIIILNYIQEGPRVLFVCVYVLFCLSH